MKMQRNNFYDRVSKWGGGQLVFIIHLFFKAVFFEKGNKKVAFIKPKIKRSFQAIAAKICQSEEIVQNKNK